MNKITAQEFKNLIETEEIKSYLPHRREQIVDARTLDEYVKFRLRVGVLIPPQLYDTFGPCLDKSTDVYVISNRGLRAKEFCRKLDISGYSTYYVEGGLEAYRKQKFPVLAVLKKRWTPKYPIHVARSLLSLKRIRCAINNFLLSQPVQNSQPVSNIQNVKIQMRHSPIGHHFLYMIGIVWFFEQLKINVTFVPHENSDDFENYTFISSEEYQLGNFVTIKFTEQQRNFYQKMAYLLDRKYAQSVISRLSINRNVREQADSWSREHLKGDWIGVHFRGTDTKELDSYVPIDTYIAYLKEVVDKHCDIFVCSDQAQFIDKMHIAFPGRVFARDIQRSYDNTSLHRYAQIKNSQQRKDALIDHRYAQIKNSQQRKDALIDLLIIAKAKLIYKTTGKFTFLAKFLNPSIKINTCQP